LDAAARRQRLPGLIADSAPAHGPLQRHRLTEPIIDDCPRCGWHGYFHQHIATVDGEWSTAVCDDCYADLHPAITVTVRFFSARSGGRSEPFAVIRQRTRSDRQFPDLGQQLAWQLSWEHTTLLAEDARGEATAHIVQISRSEAEHIAVSLAHRCWPPDAAQLRWIKTAYPSQT
jgi:RNase P subunit RPR2